MSTLDLIRRCYCAGVVVGLNEHGGPRLTGRKPEPGLLAELQEQRDDVIALLQEHRIGERDNVMNGHTRRYVSASDCLALNGCAVLGPCSNFLTLRPCDSRKGRGR